MCKVNYVNFVNVNMPDDICFCLRAILDDCPYINDIISIFEKTVDKTFKIWYNFPYSMKYQFNGERKVMLNKDYDPKAEALREHGVLNPKPEAVRDELFQKYDFFDRRDLLQVKYEMVRRVKKDGWTVTQASKTFGFSRPSFYDAQNAFNRKGLSGLVPAQRGPKKAHKLSDDVMVYAEEAIAEDRTLRAGDIASLVEKRFGFKVHPRSIERALERRKKKRRKRDGK
jgi:transposase